MTEGCGGCTLCCKVMGVRELEKPPNAWCQHCDKGKGCRIYDDRPADCRTFQCIWLETQSRADALPAALRPDRCHVVFTTSEDSKVTAAVVDPGYPDAWKSELMQRFIAFCRMKTRVMVQVGNKPPIEIENEVRFGL